ncbi:MAG: MarR family transcriptional regulator [Bosea sp. (in: a-proteobacteria)]|jgi:DNA-binding MarR family transcriptional regulator|uniref:MarR family winged helix-turn-helix transcriptional regulator n=1 Tax=unclassified Bosea (in: a-proteobacteria) TaxID=2653178 RepID=UPI00083D71BC|nr:MULTISPECIES: MarR family transcriptional regulator [unclassified Bosea (in: a-proteobacteria)]MBA4269535.1 MarR family transcriptional regulator [Methylobacterium sp.]AOG07495.1 winged helix DNA-binding domain protein [Bosea sp. RAC05]MBA4335853.1 MarR family transcriptional regulator [Methylobacterium sp.]MDP3599705.1 MarR family transcriptional regulator [Bosea sp. (in: a-proteobacteria)]WRH60242.1 MAG: MarR family transcriptional regulator [Bosea sp. (in: a-proteobacteria)]
MPQTQARSTAAAAPAPDATVPYDLIELLFFAYRDFVGGPDLILAEYGFGRAHHRVLHFVLRRPGLTIAELLDILKITKQSLNRVLKELVETGFVEQRTGVQDKRQRHLHATAAGQDLALRLVRLQAQRIQAALADLAPEAAETVAQYLAGLIDPSERHKVQGLLAAPR